MKAEVEIQAEQKILDQGELHGVNAIAEDLAAELRLFGVNELLKAVGFGHDKGLTQVILEKLREGKTVAALRIYEPQDLPENRAAAERARPLIH